MNWLTRLPGFKQSAPGREWALFRRLPAILAWGTALPALAAVAVWWAAPTRADSALDGEALLVSYQLIGLVVLHWTLVLTAAIGCVIVIVMKGPAYVADAYPLPGRDIRD